MLAAVCDLPRTSEGCDEQSAAKPVRKKAPPPRVTARRGVGSNEGGRSTDGLKGLSSVFKVFGEAPLLGFTTRLQVVRGCRFVRWELCAYAILWTARCRMPC